VGEGRRSFHDRSFAGLDYGKQQHVACPHHDKQQQSEEGKNKDQKKP
jgi:hypothetical protein